MKPTHVQCIYCIQQCRHLFEFSYTWWQCLLNGIYLCFIFIIVYTYSKNLRWHILVNWVSHILFVNCRCKNPPREKDWKLKIFVSLQHVTVKVCIVSLLNCIVPIKIILIIMMIKKTFSVSKIHFLQWLWCIMLTTQGGCCVTHSVDVIKPAVHTL